MAFNLPAAQYLMRTNASSNRGSFDNAFQTGLKNGGNLPITFGGTQVQNGGGSEGIYFGLASQNSTSGFDASLDTKVMLTSVQFNAPNRIQVQTLANRGVVARLTSGAGGGTYNEFRIGGNDTPFASAQSGPVTICLDLSATSFDSSGGSYDNSNVTGWGFGTTKTNLVGGSSNLNYFQRFFLFDTGKAQPNLPYFSDASNFEQAVLAIQGTDYTDKIGAWAVQLGPAIFLPCPFSFGNGSVPVQFDDNGLSIVSPFDNRSRQENFRLVADSMRVYFDPRNNASDFIRLKGNYTWGVPATWDANVNNASEITLTGNFAGMGDFFFGSSVTAPGTFDLASGFTVVSNGADISNITVRGDLDIAGDSVTDFTGLTVEGALDFDTPGTYTLNACVVNEVTNSSGGTVTIQNNGSVITTNTGPNINIVAPPASLTLTGLQPDTEVRVYEAGTSNEVAGVENSGTTFSASITIPSVDIVVFNVEYLPVYLDAVDTTNNVALPIQQIFDRNYKP